MQRAMTREISDSERMMLTIIGVGGGLLGLLLYFAPAMAAQATGYPATDGVAAQLGGAAYLGYPVALALALSSRAWAQLRVFITGLFTMGAGTALAGIFELASGHANTLAYIILLGGLVTAAMTGVMLYGRSTATIGKPDIAQYAVWLAIGGTVLSATFGLLPLFLGAMPAKLLGLEGQAVFLFQLGGAASLGYATMGVLALRSKNFAEIRLANVAGAVFNGLAAIAAILSFFSIGIIVLNILVAPVAAFYAIATAIMLQRRGQ